MSDKRVVSQRMVQKRAKLNNDLFSNENDSNLDWLDSIVDLGAEVSQGGSSSAETLLVPGSIPAFNVGAPENIPNDSNESDKNPSQPELVNAPNPLHPEIIIAPTKFSEIFSSDSDVDDSSESDVESEVESLVSRLRRWYCGSHVNLTQIKNLLAELKHFHPDLPSDPRTVVGTPVSTSVKSLNNGGYVHIGIAEGIVRRAHSGIKPNITRIGLDINIDGLPTSRSSSVDVWPILGRCAGFVDSRPFVIGIFCGSGKPEPLNSFLEDYINEVKVLQEKGVVVNEQTFDLFVNCYICDAPARSYLKCIKSHTGYSGCERCIQEGEHDGTKVCFDCTPSAARSDESFDIRQDENHHTGFSPLIALGTKFISQFPFCSMHLIWLGATKRFLLFMIQRAKSGAKLRAADVNQISSLLSDIDQLIPQEFARKPRSLNFFGRWKATELRLFMLYTSIVVFKPVLSQELYYLFLQFYVAIRILSYKCLVEKQKYVDFAEQLLHNFVANCAHPSVFGSGFISYNIHCLLHLCDDVRNFGSIDNFSPFPFENHLGVMKRMVRSGARVLQQLVRRLAEANFLYDLQELPFTTFVPSGHSHANEYKKLSNSYRTLSTRRKDSFFRVSQGLGQVKKIMNVNGVPQVVADVCDSVEDFFHDPIPSKKVGVMKFCGWSRTNVTLSLEDIGAKLMVLPCGNEHVAIELVHTF